MEPKLFENWSRIRNYLFNKHLDTFLTVLLFQYSFKCHYMAGAGAGAEIMDKGVAVAGVGAEYK